MNPNHLGKLNSFRKGRFLNRLQFVGGRIVPDSDTVGPLFCSMFDVMIPRQRGRPHISRTVVPSLSHSSAVSHNERRL